MKGITQLRVGDPVDHFLLIKQSTKGVTTVGKPFMSLVLQDKSGDIEAKLWDTNEEHEKLYRCESNCPCRRRNSRLSRKISTSRKKHSTSKIRRNK